VLALDSATGNVKWYYQFTPHDTHDWDATTPLVWWTQNFTGRIENCCCMQIETGFSTSSTERTAIFCWPVLSLTE